MTCPGRRLQPPVIPGTNFVKIVRQKYWDWSWDELAAYDTPAFLDFIYAKRQTQIFYVGHSQVMDVVPPTCRL